MNSETFSSRLASLTIQRGDIPKLAEKTGIPAATLYNYRRGRGIPQIDEAAKIAEATGVCLEWLATGKEPMRLGVPDPAPAKIESAPAPSGEPVPLDHDFGGDVCAAVLELYRAERSYLPNGKIMAIALEKYEEIVSSADTDEERRAMLKLVLNQLRKELRSGAATTTKGNRSA